MNMISNRLLPGQVCSDIPIEKSRVAAATLELRMQVRQLTEDVLDPFIQRIAAQHQRQGEPVGVFHRIGRAIGCDPTGDAHKEAGAAKQQQVRDEFGKAKLGLLRALNSPSAARMMWAEKLHQAALQMQGFINKYESVDVGLCGRELKDAVEKSLNELQTICQRCFALADQEEGEEAIFALKPGDVLGALTKRFQLDVSPAIVAEVEAGTEADFDRWIARLFEVPTMEEVFSGADLEPEALHPIVSQLGPAAEETTMTLAEERLRKQGFDRGWAEGLDQGRAEGLNQGMAAGRHQQAVAMMLGVLTKRFQLDVPPDIAARVEAGTEADFDRWIARLFEVTTMEEVFSGD